MVRVLLADDNPLALRYMSHLVDWESLGFEIVGMANDGEEAWEQYCLLKPQVVIMDVQMPGKNGCEVARLIREADRSTVLLFLSSYDKFDYVRAAVDLSAQEYILKHELDGSCLAEKLGKIRRLLEERKRAEQKYHHHQVTAYFCMSADEAARNRKADENGQKYRFFVVEQDHIPERLVQMWSVCTPETDYGELIGGLLECIPQIDHLIRFEPYRWAGLCAGECNLDRVAGQVLDYLDGKPGFPFSMVLFGEPDTAAECRLKYESCRYIFEQRYFEGNGVILNAELCERRACAKSDLEIFLGVLVTGESGDIIEALDRMYRQILKEQNLEKLLDLAERIPATAASCMPGFNKVFWKGDPEEMRELTSARRIMLNLRREVLCFLEYRDDMKRFQSEEMTRALHYIYQNYQDSFLGVDMIAEVAGVSVTRLNELFKMKLDTTVGKFLTKYRMEKAGILLEEGAESISRICELTGYNSTAYFAKAFRRYYGLSPMDYRQQKKRQECLRK